MRIPEPLNVSKAEEEISEVVCTAAIQVREDGLRLGVSCKALLLTEAPGGSCLTLSRQWCGI